MHIPLEGRLKLVCIADQARGGLACVEDSEATDNSNKIGYILEPALG